MRWSLDAQMKDDGSAVRAIVRRRCDTLPSGLLLRVVVDNLHTRMTPLMQYIKQLETEKVQLQTQLKKHIQLTFSAHNRNQVWNCILGGTSISDGTAQNRLDEEWALVIDSVASSKRDHKFRVNYGGGTHNDGPGPMRKFVQSWFACKGLNGKFCQEEPEPVLFHFIHYRPN